MMKGIGASSSRLSFLLFISLINSGNFRCFTHTTSSDGDRYPMVGTSHGAIRGIKQTQVDGRQNKTVTWASFYDIPYAEPPLGDLRFRPPVPYNASWECVRDGTQRSEDKTCPQVGMFNDTIRSNEDCLYLDVFVPDRSEASGPLPVMVWIHGGGYIAGAGTSDNYHPLFYMSHQVIVVQVRYRLGLLGFLSLGTEDVPGNAGVRDQVMALTWVQENIREFGGDPDLVTVNGESAGSFSSTYHLMSPLARGLFRRAILQSGPGGFSPSYHHFPASRAKKYGELAAVELGCLSTDMAEVAACMREAPVINLLAIEVLNELMSHPSIDGDHHPDPYLPAEPEEIIATGAYAKEVDVMIGFNEHEGFLGTQVMLSEPGLVEVLKAMWDIIGPYVLLQKHTSEITAEDINLSKFILYEYCGPLEEFSMNQFENFTKMCSDSFFWYGVHRFLDLHTQQATGNNFYYRMKYSGQTSAGTWAPHVPHINGIVCHGDELHYQWTHQQLDEEDARMSLALTTMWTNFVKTGHPTPDPREQGVTWEPVTKDDIRFLIIDHEMKMDINDDEDYKQRMRFWDNLPFNITL